LLWHHEDPDGIFYYDAASDMSGSVKAKVLKIVENSKVYVRIKFYSTKENETYAEVCCTLFLTVSSLIMLFYCVSSLAKIPYASFPFSAWLDERLLVDYRMMRLTRRTWSPIPKMVEMEIGQI